MYDPHDPLSAISLSNPQSKGWSARTDMVQGNRQATQVVNPIFKDGEYYTIRFGVQTPQPFVFSAEALISWNLEGNIITRRISVSNGVAISGTGQGCSVSLVDTTPSATAKPNYSITTQVSKGVRPVESAPPTLMARLDTPHLGETYGSITLLPGDSIQYNVPTDAGVISVEVVGRPDSQPTAAPPWVVVLHGNLGNNLKEYLAFQTSGYIALAPEATFVVIENFDPAVSVEVSLTWGIEG